MIFITCLVISSAFAQETTKVLITTGYSWETDSNVDDTEIIDIFDPEKTCTAPDFPNVASGAIGGLVNGDVPMICDAKECYKLTSQGFDFITTTSFWASAGVAIQDKLLLTDHSYSEFITLTGEKTPGPPMPDPGVRYQCMVKIDERTIMMIGGFDNPTAQTTNKTYFLNVETGAWSRGPDMLVGRAFMGCDIHEYEGKRYVLTIGGLWYDGTASVLPYIQAVESLELDSINPQWKLDTHLPIYLFDLQAVSIGNRLLAIGGSTIEHSSSLDIYEFICQTGRSCTWEKLQSQLKIPRVGFAAMPIPKPLITCN